MLSRSVRILNFDNSVIRQKDLLERLQPEIINLTHIGGASRIWLSKREAREIRDALDPGAKNSVTFLGSGDFHHISTLLIDQFDEDFCVIIFDLHPDMDNLPPIFSCGSWVNLAAAKKAVKKVIMLGPSSDDLSFPHNMTFNFSRFKDEQVEIYPFYHAPSLMLFKGLCTNHFIYTNEKSVVQKVSWKNLRGGNIRQFMTDLVKRLPLKNVYISIDKDCLRWKEAVTNWEPGVIGLDWLLEALRTLKESVDIIGLDIAGDYSSIGREVGLFKRFSFNWDHPRQFARDMDPCEIDRVNEATNLEILNVFLG